jgi:hypothetical protein
MSDFAIVVGGFALVLFLGMLGLFPLGRRLGHRHWQRNPKGAEAGATAIEAAVFALLGLLVAFTFSGAADRFNERRNLIAEEATAIGTAYLRIDLLPADAQPELRAEFRRYVDSRLRFYRSVSHAHAAEHLKRESEALQLSIWTQAVAAAQRLQSPAPMMLVLSALNTMIDVTTLRAMSLLQHPPRAIYLLLGLLSLLCALFAGFSTAPCEKSSKLHVGTFAAILALTIYVTLDLEYPRNGLIRVDSADQVLIELRQSMQAPPRR